MKNLLFLFLLCLLSCQGNEYSKSFSEPTAAASLEYEESADSDGASNPEMPTERKIIRNAEVRMQVENVKDFTTLTERIVKGLAGYISETNLQNNRYSIDNNLLIRVPADKLDTLLQALENQALFVNHSRISATDVTEEYLDIETRLATKKAVRERYLKILREQAKTVRDVLLAEEQIRGLTEEIEAREGRLRYLKNQIGMSTLRLNIYQKTEYVAEPDVYEKGFLTKVKEGFVGGWEILQGMVLGLIYLWPVIIVLLLLLWKRKAIGRRIRG